MRVVSGMSEGAAPQTHQLKKTSIRQMDCCQHPKSVGFRSVL